MRWFPVMDMDQRTQTDHGRQRTDQDPRRTRGRRAENDPRPEEGKDGSDPRTHARHTRTSGDGTRKRKTAQATKAHPETSNTPPGGNSILQGHVPEPEYPYHRIKTIFLFEK